MLAWEIFGEDLLWLEIYAGLGLLLVAAAWAFVPKIPVSLFALIVTVGLLCAGAFRPFNYNSDTMNYFSYVYYLRFVSASEIFFLTKLEPVHSGLILLLRDFRVWLLVESAIQTIGLFLSYRVRPNPHSFIVLCAFILTLSTSSLRFCSALIFFFYFVAYSQVTVARAIRMTIVLSLFHISMLLSGALALQKRIAPVAVTALCLAILFQSSLFLGSRVDVDLTEASRGLKTLAVALVPIIYLGFRQPLGKSVDLGLYFVSMLSVFAIASTVLPTFNRFLIMGSLVVMQCHWKIVRGESDDIFDRGVALVIAAGIVVPYVWVLPQLYQSGLW